MTVLFVERHLVTPEARASYEHAVAALVASMRSAQGFLWADATASVLTEEACTIVSEWRSGADLDAFLQADAYTSFTDGNDVRLREEPGTRRFSTDAAG